MNLKRKTAWTIGSALGAGFFPKAPGTAGSFVALPLCYYSAVWDTPSRILLWTGLFVVGTWSAKVIDQTSGTSDNQKIVIDEVVGMGITAWTAGQNWKPLLIAFILFRIFDTTKIPPVRQVDYWSKKKAAERKGEMSSWYGGFGVMADDLLASFQGLAVMLLLQFFNVIGR